ncbi:cupin domain-containing protein [Sphingobacterium litopenaei]|uniref:Cupin domain-containing protein n=1 Tax=Sphingobacterium litopenaei TaxID=2763500 RepID=A0ABR7Y9Q6_9SPHI|nr:cupin domain-containing protein [Sphingobacterium litopenaei]MBD1427963.1 cupin domain-containing protein [Sphingobacterium litopenaei]
MQNKLSKPFYSDKENDWEIIDAHVKRKICVYTPDLMLVKVRFTKGGIGALHQHPHTQISFVQSGKFKYTIGEETKIIEAGDSCIIQGNIIHGCECLKDGELIDSFSPYREDFI